MRLKAEIEANNKKVRQKPHSSLRIGSWKAVGSGHERRWFWEQFLESLRAPRHQKCHFA